MHITVRLVDFFLLKLQSQDLAQQKFRRVGVGWVVCVGVLTSFNAFHSGRMDLPREAIGPRGRPGSNCFSGESARNLKSLVIFQRRWSDPLPPQAPLDPHLRINIAHYADPHRLVMQWPTNRFDQRCDYDLIKT